ncbi:MAG TPA: tRNA (N6-isopentenyl adenosine(37)-C2)-methylthiotransferase MiaB [Halanaerobiales bacterium]|nr:tRNA (N6-isopentenyl adenosine(37)-C2)-methylthiotransferase MiaB [Halanaerobiales bacterium]
MVENKKYYIKTYGCQMNEHDSEKIAGMLEEMGYNPTDELEKADLIFLNTCTVRENAELKVFGKVGSLKRLKRANPDLIIGIGGCMMQVEEPVQKIKEKFPHVDLVIGTHNLHKLPELVSEIEESDQRIISVWDQEKGIIPDLPSVRKSDFQAWVTIMQGCDNYCSYCIVPYVRGHERSRLKENIINEVENLIEDGVIEITLLGQNVNSYAQDLEADYDFADLLAELDEIEGLKRIRYMTSHPRDFNEKTIKTIADSNKVCEHFHLPIQSGSNDVLYEMNRGYTREDYLAMIDNIKEHFDHYSITTDIIVGFPGETDEDFQDTLDIVKEVKFDMAFTFKYSKRTGTPAAKKDNQISEEVKDRRLQKLMKVQNKISLRQNKKLEGKNLEVLVEGESKNNPATFMGRSRTNKLVIFPRQEGLIGKVVKVKIDNAQSWTLYGDVIET